MFIAINTDKINPNIHLFIVFFLIVLKLIIKKDNKFPYIAEIIEKLFILDLNKQI